MFHTKICLNILISNEIFSTRAAITNYQKLGGLKQGGVFYQVPGGWKLKMKGSVGCASFVISREGCFLGFAALIASGVPWHLANSNLPISVFIRLSSLCVVFLCLHAAFSSLHLLSLLIRAPVIGLGFLS